MEGQTKRCTSCSREKLISCFSKQKAGKYGVTSVCRECRSEKAGKYYLDNKGIIDQKQAIYCRENKEKILQRQRERYHRFTDAERERSRSYRLRNLDKERERGRMKHHLSAHRRREYYSAHKPRILKRMGEYRERNHQKIQLAQSKWQKKNRDRCRAIKAKRRALKLQATPSWADLAAIREIYRTAYAMTQSNGVEYQVDHIVPLNSEIVCGLHCEDNLQIITASDNRSKGNRYWPDMP